MTKTKIVIGSLLSTLAFLPALALAQNNGGLGLGQGNLTGTLGTIRSLVDQVIPILIGLGIVAFLFGVLKFIFNAGDEGKRTDGKWVIIYSLIGIFVMVSVWGLVAVLQNAFGVQGGMSAGIQTPGIPGQGNNNQYGSQQPYGPVFR